jgi:hypothetical protein
VIELPNGQWRWAIVKESQSFFDSPGEAAKEGIAEVRRSMDGPTEGFLPGSY